MGKRTKDMPPNTSCEECGTSFFEWPYRLRTRDHHYCSRACAGIARGRLLAVTTHRPETWVDCCCKACGKLFQIPRSHAAQGRGIYCGTTCTPRRGEPLNVGDRRVGWNGYILVYMGDDVFKAEHRIVMEEVLGRPLTAEEVVHHRDQNKKNNAPENLQVMTQAEHCALHHLLRRQ